MKKKFPHSLFLLALVLSITSIGIFYTSIKPPKPVPAQGLPAEVSVTIQDVITHSRTAIRTGQTVLDTLKSLDRNDPRVKLTIKEYPGMGVLVTGMGAHSNGTNDAYWQYKVNGIMPQVGADAFVLHGGEEIGWFFAASKY